MYFQLMRLYCKIKWWNHYFVECSNSSILFNIDKFQEKNANIVVQILEKPWTLPLGKEIPKHKRRLAIFSKIACELQRASTLYYIWKTHVENVMQINSINYCGEKNVESVRHTVELKSFHTAWQCMQFFNKMHAHLKKCPQTQQCIQKIQLPNHMDQWVQCAHEKN